MRALICKVFQDVARHESRKLDIDLTDDLVLLDNGFDSLFFALLIVELESELGWDPFLADDSAHYPKTFGEFVSFYEDYERKLGSA